MKKDDLRVTSNRRPSLGNFEPSGDATGNFGLENKLGANAGANSLYDLGQTAINRGICIDDPEEYLPEENTDGTTGGGGQSSGSRAKTSADKTEKNGSLSGYGCDETVENRSLSDCGRDETPKSGSLNNNECDASTADDKNKVRKNHKKDGADSDSNAPETSENGKNGDKTVTTKSGDKLIKTIVIAGQIEGHYALPQDQKSTRYEELIPQLVQIEEDEQIGGLLLILNTVGGDVEAGLALSELIAGMKKPTASLVLGGGHSIGVPLAVSADRSFIVPSATMTLHPVRITGMILGAPQTYVYLSKMQERIIDFTCSHCKMSAERFTELMLSRDEMSTDLGSVLDGRTAHEEGLIDCIGGLSDAIDFIKSRFAG